MVLGQIVYTIDNVTNNIDSWKYAGVMKVNKDVLYELHSGKKTLWLPKRCVFETEQEARLVADSYK